MDERHEANRERVAAEDLTLGARVCRIFGVC